MKHYITPCKIGFFKHDETVDETVQLDSIFLWKTRCIAENPVSGFWKKDRLTFYELRNISLYLSVGRDSEFVSDKFIFLGQ